MVPDDRLPEDFRQLRSGNIRLRRDEVHHLGQLVDEHHDRIMARARLGQLRDQIHRHLLPRILGDRQRLQQTRRGLLRRLVALARIARPNVLEDIGIHAGPVEAALDLLQGLVLAQVPRGGNIMALVEDPRPERVSAGM